MMPFIFSAILEVFVLKSWMPLVLFLIFGLAGVMGEALFSWWWNRLFEKRFWVYRVDSVWNGYTSPLNLIPWGMGGFLYLWIINAFSKLRPDFSFKIKVGCMVIFLITFIISLGIA